MGKIALWWFGVFFFCKSKRLYGSVIQGLRKKYELPIDAEVLFHRDEQLLQTNAAGTIAAFQHL